MPGTETSRGTRAPYQIEILERADSLCASDSTGADACAPTLHLRALLMSRVAGHVDAAIACLQRATTLAPDNATYHADLGDLLVCKGRHARALNAYLSALRLVSDDARLYECVARTLQALGHLREAAGVFRLALRLEPTRVRLHSSLGDAVRALDCQAAAISCYETALNLDPTDADSFRRLGQAMLDKGDVSLALSCLQQGLRTAPNAAELHVCAGEASVKAGAPEDAVHSFRTALEIEPMNVTASRHLVEAFERSGRRDEAALAWLHLGSALQAHAHYEDAAEAFECSIALTPTSARAIAGASHACLASGRPHDGLRWALSAVSLTPDDAAAHMDLGTAHHLLGDVDAGWCEFAHYYDEHEARRRGLDCPLWDGSSLRGRTILLWPDMGRGDTVQSLRYISAVHNEGARIVVQCHHARLAPLVERIVGVERVILPGAPLPACDTHAPLNFFPSLANRARLTTSNAVPYLSVDPDLVASWRQKLGSYHGRTVGLSWGGNAETVSAASRFMSLAEFGCLGDVPDTRLVSLQHGPQAVELLMPPHGLRVERILDDTSSIVDAAALIVNMDLVISVDTMVAHLAGALGRPVWTLLRYATNWRWQSTGAKTAWYPTMRLFRQAAPGDWVGVLNDVRPSLRTS